MNVVLVNYENTVNGFHIWNAIVGCVDKENIRIRHLYSQHNGNYLEIITECPVIAQRFVVNFTTILYHLAPVIAFMKCLASVTVGKVLNFSDIFLRGLCCSLTCKPTNMLLF